MSQFFTDVIHKVQVATETAPCVCCATKEGVRRYNCGLCNRDGFCFRCSNYCIVEREEVVIKTNKERFDSAKESGKALLNSTWARLKQAKEAAQQKYRERQQKNAGDVPAASSVEGADVEEDANGGGLQEEGAAHTVVSGAVAADEAHDDRPTTTSYRLAAVCRECFRNSVHEKIDLNTVFELIDITVVEREDGPLTGDELNVSVSEPVVMLGLHAASNCRNQLRGLAKSLVRGTPNAWVVLIDLPGHGGRMDQQPVDRQANMETIAQAIECIVAPLEGVLATNVGADKETVAAAVRKAIRPIDVPEPRAERVPPRSLDDSTNTTPAAPNNSFTDSRLPVPARTTEINGRSRRIILGNGYGSYMGMEFLGAHPEQFDAAIMLNCGYAVGVEDTSLLSSTALKLAQDVSRLVGSKTLVQRFINDLTKKTIRPTLDMENVHSCLIDCGTYYHSSEDQVGALRSVSTRRSMHHYSGPVLFLDGIYDSSKNIVQDVTNVAVDNEIDRNRRLQRGVGSEVSDVSADEEEDGSGRLILSRAIHYPKGSRFFIHDTRFQHEVSSDIRLFLLQLLQQPVAPYSSLRTPAKVAASRNAPKPVHAAVVRNSVGDSAQAASATTPKEPLSGSPTPRTEVAPTIPEPAAAVAPTTVAPVIPETAAPVAVVVETTPEEVNAEDVAAVETAAPATEGDVVGEEIMPAPEAPEATSAAPEEENAGGDSPAAEEHHDDGGVSKKKKGKGKKGGKK